MDKFQQVLQHGSYFNPANKRYKENAIVSCDRCSRKDIPSCIGYRELDLCLTCAAAIERNPGRLPQEVPELPGFRPVPGLQPMAHFAEFIPFNVRNVGIQQGAKGTREYCMSSNCHIDSNEQEDKEAF
jgi:hypothetical protein